MNQVAARIKELERKNRTLDAEYQQAKDDLTNSERSRRAAEAERDELQEELQSGGPKL